MRSKARPAPAADESATHAASPTPHQVTEDADQLEFHTSTTNYPSSGGNSRSGAQFHASSTASSRVLTTK